VGAADQIAAPEALYCHCAIKAPLGLHDELVHVWEKDGVLVSSIKLDVKGGREAGFRTWSKISVVTPGQYACTVETASGQVLGGTVAVVTR
ncbi:MAG TPA: DUF2914 domain-containing protein, partial [Myxococcota bacterium]